MESGIRRRLNDGTTSMLHLRYKPRKGKKLHAPHSYLLLVRKPPFAQRMNTPKIVEQKEKKKTKKIKTIPKPRWVWVVVAIQYPACFRKRHIHSAPFRTKDYPTQI
jgi:hypothetical protein